MPHRDPQSSALHPPASGGASAPDAPLAGTPGLRAAASQLLGMEQRSLSAGVAPASGDEPITPAPPATELSLGQLAVRSGAWQLGAYAVQSTTRFASNVLLTRLVEPHLLGLSAVVAIVLMGLEMFSDVGIGPNIVQNRKGETERFLRTAFTVQALRGATLFIVGCAIAWPVSLYTGHPIHFYLVPLAAVVALIEGFRSTAWFRLQRRLRIRPISIVQTSATLLGAAIMLTWAAIAPSIWALVVPMVIVSVLQVLATHTLLRDRRDRFGWDPESARELFGFGGWVFVSTALTFLANSADRVLFAGQISMAQLGVYNIAFILAMTPTQALVRLGTSVVFPAYANVRDDARRFASVFHRVRGPLTLLGGFAAACLIGAGRPLVDVIYPPAFEDAGWMLQVLAVAGWLQVLQTSNDAALLATGRPKWVAIGHCCKFVALLAGISLGWRLPAWTGWAVDPFAGAVTGVAAAEFVRYLVSSHMMHRLGLHAIRRDALVSLWVVASAAAGGGVAYALFENEVIDLLAAGAVITLLWLPAGMPVLGWLRNRRQASRPSATA